jgi:hypothetical protein
VRFSSVLEAGSDTSRLGYATIWALSAILGKDVLQESIDTFRSTAMGFIQRIGDGIKSGLGFEVGEETAQSRAANAATREWWGALLTTSVAVAGFVGAKDQIERYISENQANRPSATATDNLGSHRQDQVLFDLSEFLKKLDPNVTPRSDAAHKIAKDVFAFEAALHHQLHPEDTKIHNLLFVLGDLRIRLVTDSSGVPSSIAAAKGAVEEIIEREPGSDR